MANKLAVITGASSGIGLEIARLASGEGYDLIVASDTPQVDASAGLDGEVGRLWSIVRCGVEILWAAFEGDADELSRNLTLLKALED